MGEPSKVPVWLQNTAVSAEFKVLACCAHRSLEAQRRALLIDTVQQDLSWPRLAHLAFLNHLVPLCFHHLKSVCPSLVPSWLLRNFEIHFQECAWRKLLLSEELNRLLLLFEREGIQVVPLKGPVMAHALYGNISLRDFEDLDLLVRREDVASVKRVLTAEGYVTHLPLNPAREKNLLRSQSKILFHNQARRFRLDLHWEIAPRFFSLPVSLASLTPRLRRATIGEHEIWQPCPEDLVLILCAHGAKHLWNRLSRICDVSELINSHDIDWDRIFALAEGYGARRILYLGLWLCQQLLGAALPELVAEKLTSDAELPRMGSRVLEHLQSGDDIPEVRKALPFHLAVRERFRDRAAYCLRYLLLPTEGDLLGLRLPARLFFLNYPARPFRLAGTVAFRWLTRGKAPALAKFIPTPQNVVDRELELARIQPGDVLYDLGCGDGRIVITAALHYGIRAVGIEKNPELIERAKRNAQQHGVEHLVSFRCTDATRFDFSDASIVIIYLSARGNQRVRPLLKQLRPGTRIISLDFDLPQWTPDSIEAISDPWKFVHHLYLWTVKS